MAGHSGMVGSAIIRALESCGYENIITRPSDQLDLRNQAAVLGFFLNERPEYVYLAAAKVGGIHANDTYRAQFLYDNLMIAANVIHAAYIHKVVKLLFLGSSCIYPKMAEQPIKESSLLTGSLETTNEPYAIAKIAGLKLCQEYRHQYGCNFISAMPANLYGPNDNYEVNDSHVLPALIRKFHEAKLSNRPSVEIWGSGTPKREFLHVDDLAAGCLFLMDNYNGTEHINIGSGKEVFIKELALTIKGVVGFDGELIFDSTKPDGAPRKLMDVSRLTEMGWRYGIELEDGVSSVYKQYSEAQSTPASN